MQHFLASDPEGAKPARQARILLSTFCLTYPRQALPCPGMKNVGKARKAALRLIFISVLSVLAIWVIGAFAVTIAAVISRMAFAITAFLAALWSVFAFFIFYFFRDPDAQVPMGAGLVLSPAHGKVDYIGTTTEPEFMGGECQRVSIFLSVFDVHVQNAPVAGKVAFFKSTAGQFLSALKAESAVRNENVLLGFEASEPHGQKIGIRLIAGVLARRIVPFVQAGDELARGERISLIQFGSRTDVYLPAGAKIKVKLGEHVVGGETVLAVFEPAK
jgi:phosphatidylserine decarboxylase